MVLLADSEADEGDQESKGEGESECGPVAARHGGGGDLVDGGGEGGGVMTASLNRSSHFSVVLDVSRILSTCI